MRQSQFSKALTIALPPEHFEQIKQITDEQKISIAAWIRDVVAAALEKLEQEEVITNDQ